MATLRHGVDSVDLTDLRADAVSPALPAADSRQARIRAPRPVAQPLQAATPGIGLLRASREPAASGLDPIRPPTAKELHSITLHGLLVIFDQRRVAEITRPRVAQDDVKAAQYLKAQKALEAQGWAASGIDVEHHAVFYGCQVVFKTGMSPATIALLFQWAVPFGLDTPGDVSKDPEWRSLLDSGAVLYPQLEAEVHGCRSGGREFSMPASLFSKIRTLAEAYFRLRAEALVGLLDMLGSSSPEEQAKAAIRGYIDQARTLPPAWQHIESMIDLGVLRQHGADPAVAENAARVVMARAFLTTLLRGQAPSWGVDDLIHTHLQHRPSATLLHSTDFARLALTSPSAAALAASLPGLGHSTPQLATPAPSSPAASLSAPVKMPLTAMEVQLGFRAGPNGTRTHPLYHAGEYATPPGWLPPPQTAPPPTTGTSPPGARLPRANVALSIPTARLVVGRSSPFSISSPHPCDYCHLPGHAQYECPRRFADTYHRPLPGFTSAGSPDPACWVGGDLTPQARAALAGFLVENHIPAHRKFGVTVEHIASGTAPQIKA